MKRFVTLLVLTLTFLSACSTPSSAGKELEDGDVEYTEAEAVYRRFENWKAISTRIDSVQQYTLPDGTIVNSPASYVLYTLNDDGSLVAEVDYPGNEYMSTEPLYTPNWDVPVIDFQNYECRIEDGIYFCKTQDGGDVRMRPDGDTLYLFCNGRQWTLWR